MVKQHRLPQNPILASIEVWLSSLSSEAASVDADRAAKLLASAPKRFTTYEPMVLLPTGSFTTVEWVQLLDSLDDITKSRLWSSILRQISSKGRVSLTHLATNEAIPLQDGDQKGAENLLRSPCGLRLLYGDFGPASASDPECQEEFDKAFWVSTKQNGVIQTWAPRWTMFSRGNIKEKARLMAFPAVVDRTSEHWAVDLYAGIGYFVFSYARLGYRVLCWEINPWSIEGLRRGAIANGWSVKIVQGDDLATPLDDLLTSGEQIVVFSESNEKALGRLEAMRLALSVEHVNCGFLPTSRPVWEAAWKVTLGSSDAWLHLHDNVGTKDVEARKEEIQQLYDTWSSTDCTRLRRAQVEHVEYVKTYAPDVWHCVFDIHITASHSQPME